MLKTGRGRAGRAAEVTPFAADRRALAALPLDGVDVHDPPGARRGNDELGRAGAGLAFPGRRVAAGAHPARAVPREAGPGQVGAAAANALAGGAVTWTGTPKSNMSSRTSIAIVSPVEATGSAMWYASRRTRWSWPIQTSIGIRWVPSIATSRASDFWTAARRAAGACLAALS